MKKLCFAAAASLMLIYGSMTAFSSHNNPVYEPVIEFCTTQTWPNIPGFPGGAFVMACLPGGNETCALGFCSGQIR